MSKNSTDEQFSVEESKRRFEAALRGARMAGSQHRRNAAPKKSKPQQKRKTAKRS
jgi:hypothetical protein